MLQIVKFIKKNHSPTNKQFENPVEYCLYYFRVRSRIWNTIFVLENENTRRSERKKKIFAIYTYILASFLGINATKINTNRRKYLCWVSDLYDRF